MTSIKLGELCHYLEEIAPLSLQESYDNSGLIIGHPDWIVRSVLISLDATEEIIDEAIRIGCNVVISHHPIIFKGLKNITGQHYVDRAIIKAIKHDIALYAIHTNLDNILQNGVNQKIASRLGLLNLEILAPKSTDTGAGIIGLLAHPLSLSEFIPIIKSSLDVTMIRHTRDTHKLIRKVSICGGSGAFLIANAIQAQADAYITADVKYHEFFEANNQLVIIDIGHYESEQHTVELLFELISKKYSNFAAHCAKTNTNPVQYI